METRDMRKPIASGSVSGPVIEGFWAKVIAWKWPDRKRGVDWDMMDPHNLATLQWADKDKAPSYAQVKAAGAEYKASIGG